MATISPAYTYIVPQTTYEITMPSQPAFLAYLGGADNNVTGNGTVYTLGTNTAFIQVYDANADLTLNPVTFTAPVTGRYLLSMNVRVTGVVADGLYACQIVTSNGSYDGHSIMLAALNSSNAQLSIVADMDAADTATFTAIGTGQGGDVLDLDSTALITYACGYLLT